MKTQMRKIDHNNPDGKSPETPDTKLNMDVRNKGVVNLAKKHAKLIKRYQASEREKA